jgi:cell shape-determining protein MreC
MAKRSFHFGFSTIIITFVMLCIVTFCALALLTANADYKLSRKVAEKTSAYYEAEESAYETLAELDALLSDTYREALSQKEYTENARTALQQYAADHTDITVLTEPALAVTYTIPFSDTQTLSITCTVSYPPENDGICYTLTEWKTISTAPESDAQTLDLIG